MRVSKPPTKWIFRIIGLSGYPSSRIALSLGGVGLCQSALEQSEYILWPFRAHHSIDSVTWSKLCTSLGVRTAQVFYRFLCPGFGRRRTMAGRATFLTPSRPSSRLISEVAWSAKASHTTQSAPPQREQKQMPARPSCLLIGILLSHSGWPAGRLLAPSENPGSGTRLVGEISNERAGYLHFHGSSLSLTSGPEFSISTLFPRETIGRSRKEAMRFLRAWLARVVLPLDASPNCPCSLADFFFHCDSFSLAQSSQCQYTRHLLSGMASTK